MCECLCVIVSVSVWVGGFQTKTDHAYFVFHDTNKQKQRSINNRPKMTSAELTHFPRTALLHFLDLPDRWCPCEPLVACQGRQSNQLLATTLREMNEF